MNQRLWPMLAVRGEPFDSPEYLFEVKWNGIRALASRSHESQPTGGWDLWGRELADYRSRYPEMQVLAALPPGTILDGELVRWRQGLPDLEAILARHQLSHPAKIQHASRHQPVTYVVFDLLAHHGRSLVGQPLHERRALLQDVLARWQEPRVPFSEGIVGSGRVFFEQAVRQGQEGVMAKHLASRYLPGKRSSCWLKIKPARPLPGVIIGWEPGVLGLRTGRAFPRKKTAGQVLGHDPFLTLAHCLFEKHPARPYDAFGEQHAWFLPAGQQVSMNPLEIISMLHPIWRRWFGSTVP